MALGNEVKDKESIESIACFIINAVGCYIGKKSKNRADEPNIFDYLFNENNSVTAEKDVVENVYES